MKRSAVLIGLLAILAVSVYAQLPMLKANIPFEFMVGGKAFPAGNYEFTVNAEHTSVMVRNVATGKTTNAGIVTALAPSKASDVMVTFDQVGDKKILEAVWPAETEGFLLHATKGKHTHEVVKAAAKE